MNDIRHYPKCGRAFKNTYQDRYCGKIETINPHISVQAQEVRPILQKVREIIRAAVPNAVEKMAWNMPPFWQGKYLIHFAALKKHPGIYPGDLSLAPFETRLIGYHRTKSAIQFLYDKPFDFKLIADITHWQSAAVMEQTNGRV